MSQASGMLTMRCCTPASAWARARATTSAGVMRPGRRSTSSSAVISISATSRPSRRSGSRSTSSLRADLVRLEDEEVAGVGVPGDEAESAPSPLPPIMIGGWGRASGCGRMIGSASSQKRPAKGTGRRPRADGRSEASPRACAKRSRRSGQGMPRPRASCWYQPAPIPKVSRPPESTSTVVAVFTSSPGERNMAQPDEGAEPDPRGHAGQEAEGRVGLEHRLLRPAQAGVVGELEEMVHHPERLEPGSSAAWAMSTRWPRRAGVPPGKLKEGSCKPRRIGQPPQPAVPVRRRRAG